MSDILPTFFFFNVFFTCSCKPKSICISKSSFKPDIILHMSFVTHIGSGWGCPTLRLYFHFSSPCSAVLCIYSGRSVGRTLMVFGCCWAVLAQHQDSLSNPPLRRTTRCRQARGLEGRSWCTSSELTQKILHTVCIILSHKREGGKEKGGLFRAMVFAFWRNGHVYQFPTAQKFTGHLSVCWHETVNKFLLFFLPFHMCLLPFLLNCLYFNPWSCPSHYLSVLLRVGAGSQPVSALHNIFCSYLLSSNKKSPQLIK